MRQKDFNPLPPHGGRLLSPQILPDFHDFNPLPPHGGRPFFIIFLPYPLKFQSTPSTRRETRIAIICCFFCLFQSTPSTRRETHLVKVSLYCCLISIHSLHTEGDACSGSCAGGFVISIHSLHTEGDEGGSREKLPSILFQSTPSTRRETDMQWYLVRIHRHFNPLPPHGGRQLHPFHPFPVCWISIHSEGDP